MKSVYSLLRKPAPAERCNESKKRVDKPTESINRYIKPRVVIDIAAAEDEENKLRNEEQFAMNELKVLNFRTCSLHAIAAKLGNDYKKHHTTVTAVRARLHNIQAQRKTNAMITCANNEGAANAASCHFFILLATPLGACATQPEVKRHKGDEVLVLLPGDRVMSEAHVVEPKVDRVMSEHSWTSILLQNRQSRSYGASCSVMGPPAAVAVKDSAYDMWGRMMNGGTQTLPRGEGHSLSCTCKFCKAKDSVCNPHLV